MTSDEACLREIELLRHTVDTLARAIEIMQEQLAESERQRDALAKHLNEIGQEGINAATGAGK